MKSTRSTTSTGPDGRSGWDQAAMPLMLLGILGFAQEYVNPWLTGAPLSRPDVAWNQAYLGPMRRALFESGSLHGWNSVAFDGVPWLGHPHSQVFFPPVFLPLLLLDPAWGVRVVYFACLVLAGLGMYLLARLLGARPMVSGWVGLLFVLSGTLTSRIYAGHAEFVLAVPWTPWLLASALLVGRATSLQHLALWAAVAGLVHGITFLIGSLYVPYYLLFVTPLVLTISALGNRALRARIAFPLAIGSWAAALALTTAAKLLAAQDLLQGASRAPDPFKGSQHAFWGLVHLVYPFAAYGPTRPGAVLPELPYFGRVPGPDGWSWWEYSQYVGFIPVAFAALIFVPLLARLFGRRISIAGRNADVLALIGVCAVAFSFLAIQYGYSLIHWIYVALPPIRQFQVPSRALILLAIAVLALAALGLETLLRAVEQRRTIARFVIWPVMAFALVDVYLVTNWVPQVVDAAATEPIQRLVAELERRDAGPFTVHLGWIGTQNYRQATSELANRGIRLDSYLTPLKPLTADQHAVIGPERRARYAIAPAGSPPDLPGAWELLLRDAQPVRYAIAPVAPSPDYPHGWELDQREVELAVYVNRQATGDGYLVHGTTVEPLRLTADHSGGFRGQLTAPEGARLVVPANPFPGWRVSVDGGPPQAAGQYDHFVAVTTRAGEHQYAVFYEAPNGRLIVLLAALPWLAGLTVVAYWGVTVLRRRRTPRLASPPKPPMLRDERSPAVSNG